MIARLNLYAGRTLWQHSIIMGRPGRIVFPLILLLALSGHTRQGEFYFTDSGRVTFSSEAPLEYIQASSSELAGILNLTDQSFSFTVPMVSFFGFNSALQRTHFNENYMESEKYPHSTFKGKIIEAVDFGAPGTYQIRAKGLLNVHGTEADRIIRCSLQIEAGRISVKSEFKVPLEDHQIKIPSIVQQKIAEVIDVSIQFELVPLDG